MKIALDLWAKIKRIREHNQIICVPYKLVLK